MEKRSQEGKEGREEGREWGEEEDDRRPDLSILSEELVDVMFNLHFQPN